MPRKRDPRDCLRCGHHWQPRLKGRARDREPVQCPRCKSPFWNTPRKRTA